MFVLAAPFLLPDMVVSLCTWDIHSVPFSNMYAPFDLSSTQVIFISYTISSICSLESSGKSVNLILFSRSFQKLLIIFKFD